MSIVKIRMRRIVASTAILVAGTALQFGFVSGCNDRLLGLVDFVDPCLTILGNCAPGSFQSINAEIGDFCIDPTCTIPGGCGYVTGGGGPPLGTQRDLCP